ncbi:MAG: trypsin-like peptidase domain-containing protein [Clostridia bacterium]|nr:trypsin-like peptidase domain-containing protein [Clostridia bacterium]
MSNRISPFSRFLRGLAFLLCMVLVSGGSIVIYDLVRTSHEAVPQPTEPNRLVASSPSDLMDKSPAEVAQSVLPSVVCIQNYQTQRRPYFGYGMPNNKDGTITLAGEGSGIIVSEDGHIATNDHVIENAELIKVILSDGEAVEAKLIGTDPDTDLALIKIEKTGLTAASMGETSSLVVGEFVMAVGNPGGSEFANSVSLGIVSALNRPLQWVEDGYVMNTIQTDAAINPGNSGGALVNLKGQVVGICSAKYVQTGYEGLGFAITIDEALPILNDLQAYGYVKNRSRLGISGQYLDEMTAAYYDLEVGFYVAEIENKDVGDLKVGDVITEVDGKPVDSSGAIKTILQGKTPGTVVTLTIYRESTGKTLSTQLTLQESVPQQ